MQSSTTSRVINGNASSPTSSRGIQGSASSPTVSSSSSAGPPKATVSPTTMPVSHIIPSPNSILRIQQLQTIPHQSQPYYDPNPYEYFHRCQALERKLAIQEEEVAGLRQEVVTKESVIQSFTAKISYITMENKKMFEDKREQLGVNRQLTEKIRQLEVHTRAKDEEIGKLTQEVNQFASGNSHMEAIIQTNNKLKEDIKKLEIKLHTVNGTLTKVNEEKGKVVNELKVVKENAETRRKLLLQKDSELGKILQENNTLKGIQKELDKARKEEGHLKRINLDLNDQVGRLQQELTKAKEELKVKKESAKETETAIQSKDQLQQALKAMKKLMGEKDQEITNLGKKVKGLEKVLKDTNTEIHKLTENKNLLGKEIEEREGKLKWANDELKRHQNKVADMGKELEGARGKCKKWEVAVVELRELLAKKDKGMEEMKTKQKGSLKDAESEVNGLRNQVAELRQEVGGHLSMIKEQQVIVETKTKESKVAEDRAKAREKEVERLKSGIKQKDFELVKERVKVKEGAQEVDRLTKVVAEKCMKLAEVTNKVNEVEKALQDTKKRQRPLAGEMKKVRHRVETIAGRVETMRSKLHESYKLLDNVNFAPKVEKDDMLLLVQKFDVVQAELQKSQAEVKSKNEQIEELIREKERIEEDLREQEDGIVQILQSRIESVQFSVSEVGSEAGVSNAETQTEVVKRMQKGMQTDVTEKPPTPIISTEEVGIQVETSVPPQMENVSTQVESNELATQRPPAQSDPTPPEKSVSSQIPNKNGKVMVEPPPSDDRVDIVDLTQSEGEEEEELEEEEEKEMEEIEEKSLVIRENIREDENGNELVDITISDPSNSFQEHIQVSTKGRDSPWARNGWQPLEPMTKDVPALEPSDRQDSSSLQIPTSQQPERVKYDVQIGKDETIILVIQGGRYSQNGQVKTSYDRLRASDMSQTLKQIESSSSSICDITQRNQLTVNTQVEQTSAANNNTPQVEVKQTRKRGRKPGIRSGSSQEDLYPLNPRYSAETKLSYADICRQENVVVIDDGNDNDIDLVPDTGVGHEAVVLPQKRKYTRSKIAGRKKKRKR